MSHKIKLGVFISDGGNSELAPLSGLAMYGVLNNEVIFNLYDGISRIQLKVIK